MKMRQEGIIHKKIDIQKRKRDNYDRQTDRQTDRQRRKLKFIVASAIILVCTLFVLKFDNVPNGILMSVADRMSYTDKILFVLTMFRAE